MMESGGTSSGYVRKSRWGKVGPKKAPSTKWYLVYSAWCSCKKPINHRNEKPTHPNHHLQHNPHLLRHIYIPTPPTHNFHRLHPGPIVSPHRKHMGSFTHDPRTGAKFPRRKPFGHGLQTLLG